MMIKARIAAVLLVTSLPHFSADGAAQDTQLTACQRAPLALQILGSGGPELTDRRASSSHLIWQDGKAVVMIDAGAGSALRFEQSGANLQDLQAIAFTHLHVDHSADFAALVKATYFTNRTQNLPIFGPTGNNLLPSMHDFAEALFGQNGAWPYLNSYINPQAPSPFHIIPHTIKTANTSGTEETSWRTINKDLRLGAVTTHHGPLPALAWRVEIDGYAVTFSGDMSNRLESLKSLAQGSDILAANNAVPELAKGGARSLHMPPSEIGRIAAAAKVKRLVLSHRMTRTLGSEASTEKQIRRSYTGPLDFSNDLDCFQIQSQPE